MSLRITGIQNEDAVSVTLGTILVVALVVILAAFVSAVAFGMIGSSITSKIVGMTVSVGSLPNASPTALITIQGGSDLERMTGLEYAIDDTMAWCAVTDADGNVLDSGSDYPLETGDMVATGCDSPVGKRLLLRGTFTDGCKQILFDKNF